MSKNCAFPIHYVDRGNLAVLQSPTMPACICGCLNTHAHQGVDYGLICYVNSRCWGAQMCSELPLARLHHMHGMYGQYTPGLKYHTMHLWSLTLNQGNVYCMFVQYYSQCKVLLVTVHPVENSSVDWKTWGGCHGSLATTAAGKVPRTHLIILCSRILISVNEFVVKFWLLQCSNMWLQGGSDATYSCCIELSVSMYVC